MSTPAVSPTFLVSLILTLTVGSKSTAQLAPRTIVSNFAAFVSRVCGGVVREVGEEGSLLSRGEGTTGVWVYETTILPH